MTNNTAILFYGSEDPYSSSPRHKASGSSGENHDPKKSSDSDDQKEGLENLNRLHSAGFFDFKSISASMSQTLKKYRDMLGYPR